jgi:hypothetical protein
VGKPEGKRPLGRLRCRWEDNLKIDYQDVRWWGMDSIDPSQVRARSSGVRFRSTSNAAVGVNIIAPAMARQAIL